MTAHEGVGSSEMPFCSLCVRIVFVSQLKRLKKKKKKGGGGGGDIKEQKKKKK